jgi:hypothetical protein
MLHIFLEPGLVARVAAEAFGLDPAQPGRHPPPPEHIVAPAHVIDRCDSSDKLDRLECSDEMDDEARRAGRAGAECCSDVGLEMAVFGPDWRFSPQVQIRYRKGCAGCKTVILDTPAAGRYPQKSPDFTHPVHGLHRGSRFCIGK